MSKKIDIKNSLQDLIFSNNIQKILWFFLNHPSGTPYDREISRQTGMSRAGTNLALRELVDGKLLTREKKGRMFFYSIDAKNVLIRQLKILQNILQLKPLLDTIQDYVNRIVLYGSAAEGKNLEESDMDILIITRSKDEVIKKIHKDFFRLNLQPLVHTAQEWSKIERENPVFSDQVAKGIVLWNSDES